MNSGKVQSVFSSFSSTNSPQKRPVFHGTLLLISVLYQNSTEISIVFHPSLWNIIQSAEEEGENEMINDIWGWILTQKFNVHCSVSFSILDSPLSGLAGVTRLRPVWASLGLRTSVDGLAESMRGLPAPQLLPATDSGCNPELARHLLVIWL